MYSNRKYIIEMFMALVALIMVIKLFYVQVVSDTYKTSADSNSQRKEVIYPSRGLIYDRNGKLLVSNQAVYDIMIIPRATERSIKARGVPALSRGIPASAG